MSWNQSQYMMRRNSKAEIFNMEKFHTWNVPKFQHLYIMCLFYLHKHLSIINMQGYDMFKIVNYAMLQILACTEQKCFCKKEHKVNVWWEETLHHFACSLSWNNWAEIWGSWLIWWDENNLQPSHSSAHNPSTQLQGKQCW